MKPLIDRSPRPGTALLVESADVGLITLAIEECARPRVVRSAEELEQRVRAGEVQAVIVSSTHILNGARSRVATLKKLYPDLVVAGWMTESDNDRALQAALRFGSAGATYLVRSTGKVHGLRAAVTAPLCSVLGEALAADPFLLGAMRRFQEAGPTEGWKKFIAAIFCEEVVTVRQLAKEVGVLPSTLMSRFFRFRLPAPKRYLALLRLTAALRTMERNKDLSLAEVAGRYGHSSSQSFARHVRRHVGMTPAEARERVTGEAFLEKVAEELLSPSVVASLRTFDPTKEV